MSEAKIVGVKAYTPFINLGGIQVNSHFITHVTDVFPVEIHEAGNGFATLFTKSKVKTKYRFRVGTGNCDHSFSGDTKEEAEQARADLLKALGL